MIGGDSRNFNAQEALAGSGEIMEHKEPGYEALPEWSPEAFPADSSFTRDSYEVSKELFLAKMAEALANPDWLLFPNYTEEHETRRQKYLPCPRFVMPDDVAFLRDLQKMDLRSAAEKIYAGEIKFPGSRGSGTDVVVRALD